MIFSSIGSESEFIRAVQNISSSLHALGNANAATPMGAIEAHGAVVKEVGERSTAVQQDMVEAVHAVADAILEHSKRVDEVAGALVGIGKELAEAIVTLQPHRQP